MSTTLKNSEEGKNRAYIQHLCEIGLYNYTFMICEAYSKRDWDKLNDVSLKFERDCYNIGEVEIVGKLIILRLLLEAHPTEGYYVEGTLRKIFELTYALQKHLITYLENLSVKLDENKIHYITKIEDLFDEKYNSWSYNSCSLQ